MFEPDEVVFALVNLGEAHHFLLSAMWAMYIVGCKARAHVEAVDLLFEMFAEHEKLHVCFLS